MDWFDGTFDYSKDDLEEEFPVEVTPELRLSEDGKRIAVISDFSSDTFVCEPSDPGIGEDRDGCAFYHVFIGKDAAIAKRTADAFLKNADDESGGRIVLFRKEEDRFILYSYGAVCPEPPAALADPRVKSGEAYYLPLKRYLFKCPVCGHRTLPFRGYYLICGECGWEDDGIDDDDDEPLGANGDYTIRQYRQEYLKLKKEDPDYSWKGEINDDRKER